MSLVVILISLLLITSTAQLGGVTTCPAGSCNNVGTGCDTGSYCDYSNPPDASSGCFSCVVRTMPYDGFNMSFNWTYENPEPCPDGTCDPYSFPLCVDPLQCVDNYDYYNYDPSLPNSNCYGVCTDPAEIPPSCDECTHDSCTIEGEICTYDERSHITAVGPSTYCLVCVDECLFSPFGCIVDTDCALAQGYVYDYYDPANPGPLYDPAYPYQIYDEWECKKYGSDRCGECQPVIPPYLCPTGSCDYSGLCEDGSYCDYNYVTTPEDDVCPFSCVSCTDSCDNTVTDVCGADLVCAVGKFNEFVGSHACYTCMNECQSEIGLCLTPDDCIAEWDIYGVPHTCVINDADLCGTCVPEMETFGCFYPSCDPYIDSTDQCEANELCEFSTGGGGGGGPGYGASAACVGVCRNANDPPPTCVSPCDPGNPIECSEYQFCEIDPNQMYISNSDCFICVDVCAFSGLCASAADCTYTYGAFQEYECKLDGSPHCGTCEPKIVTDPTDPTATDPPGTTDSETDPGTDPDPTDPPGTTDSGTDPDPCDTDHYPNFGDCNDCYSIVDGDNVEKTGYKLELRLSVLICNINSLFSSHWIMYNFEETFWQIIGELDGNTCDISDICGSFDLELLDTTNNNLGALLPTTANECPDLDGYCGVNGDKPQFRGTVTIALYCGDETEMKSLMAKLYEIIDTFDADFKTKSESISKNKDTLCGQGFKHITVDGDLGITLKDPQGGIVEQTDVDITRNDAVNGAYYVAILIVLSILSLAI